MNTCPCKSGKTYELCCEPFILEEKFPKTAEELLRSRYSAFVKKETDYIFRTIDEDRRSPEDLEAAQQWADNAVWEGLEIIEIQNGNENDSSGEIEFLAKFSLDGKAQNHYEHAVFTKKQSRWYFTEALPVKAKTVVRDEAKVGRNDPCTCGSGKKYKKCCG